MRRLPTPTEGSEICGGLTYPVVAHIIFPSGHWTKHTHCCTITAESIRKQDIAYFNPPQITFKIVSPNARFNKRKPSEPKPAYSKLNTSTDFWRASKPQQSRWSTEQTRLIRNYARPSGVCFFPRHPACRENLFFQIELSPALDVARSFECADRMAGKSAIRHPV